MKSKLKLSSSLLCILFILGCKKDKPVSNIKLHDYAESYKYFPIKAGREWNYEVKIVDSIKGTYEIINELGKYNEDSLRTDYYRNGKLWSYTYWNNIGSIMGCCGDMVLIDYDLLGCTSDSIQIYQSSRVNTNIKIYQFCKKVLAKDVVNYEKIECIKTVQLNKFTSGNSLQIINYFGFGVGLIFREETTFDKFGKKLKIETQKLLSNNF